MTKYCIPESRISEQYAVPRHVLKGLRDAGTLKRKEHWMPIKRVITYTEDAVKLIGEQIRPLSAPPPAPILPADAPLKEELTVANSSYPNRKIILAVRANGEKVMVRVGSADNYRVLDHKSRPMKVHAYCVQGRWTRAGRDPRFPGRW